MSELRFTRNPDYDPDRPVPNSVRDWVRANMATKVSLVTLAEDGVTKTLLFEREAGE